RITTLPNGLRVASEGTPGHFASVGVFVDAGSRYESPNTQGCSHLLDRMAFKSTKRRDGHQLMAEMEELGGNLTCSSSRECLMYQAAVFKQDVNHTVDLLADVVRAPRLTEEELQEQRETVPYEVDEIWSKPELILPELLHQAAYQGNTLGLPLLCAPERLEQINLGTLAEYRRRWYQPGRVVLAGAGVPHEELVALAQRHFGDWAHNQGASSILRNLSSAAATMLGRPAHASSDLMSAEDPYTLAMMPSRYTGGTLALDVPDQEHTHLYVGFEAVGLANPDMYPLATLQLLLGGGGSFSAGGPGKGMYSRLYTRVLNRHHWVESCVAFLHGYSDSGLFGISASCRPDWAHALADVVARELSLLAEPGAVEQSELDRAKNQLKSSVLMNLESRMVQLEDLARQVQVYGQRVSAEEMRARVDAVTLEDIHRVAGTMLHGSGRKPTVVSYGPVRQLKDVSRVLHKYGIGQ
ncbi:LuxS/MPP-like metallohydrolase, partial [Thamnocephalis sphaerospora]